MYVFYLFSLNSTTNIKSSIIVKNLHRLQAYKIIQRTKIDINIFLLYTIKDVSKLDVNFKKVKYLVITTIIIMAILYY